MGGCPERAAGGLAALARAFLDHLDLPRKQARKLPKALSREEIERILTVPNPLDLLGLRDRMMLELPSTPPASAAPR